MAARTMCWRLPTISMFALLFLMFWLSLPESADGSPIWTLPASAGSGPSVLTNFKEKSQCHKDIELLDICQRCAKATKSEDAYPMCCTNAENAVKWCKDYLYYGIQ